MKQFTFLLIIFTLLSYNSFSIPKSNQKDNKSNKSDEKITIQIKWYLHPVLHEISGICWIDEQRMACVQDELGIIYIFNFLSAKIENKIPFAGPGDFESITKDGDTYFVMRSDGRIFEIRMSSSKNPTVIQYDLPFDKTLDYEGFFYDKSKKRLLITFKEPDPQTKSKIRGIYAFDPVKKTMSSKPVYEIDLSNPLINKQDKDDDKKDKDLYKNFFPSDIAINPVTSEIYMTNGINPSILVLDKTGKMKRYFKLDKDNFPQPEGITFSSNGDMFLSSEGVKHNGIIAKAIIGSGNKNENKKKD